MAFEEQASAPFATQTMKLSYLGYDFAREGISIDTTIMTHQWSRDYEILIYFLVQYPKYHRFHLDWQKSRIMFMLDSIITSRRGGAARQVPRQIHRFVKGCIHAWRCGGGRDCIPKREVLERIQLPPCMQLPDEGELREVLDDLGRMGRRRAEVIDLTGE